MEDCSSVAQFLKGKTVFITGATGFLAKILVEKILRIQPNIGKLYLLIRGSSTKSSGQRLHEEIIETELFSVLREKWGEKFSSSISEQVVSISGDVSYENLGIEDSDLRDQMYREIDIMINSAATTSFFERYDTAMAVNTWGALHALNFAKKCLKIKVFLHVSTAYVWGERAGLLPEKPFSMNETLNGVSYLDIDAEKRLADERVKELEAEKESFRAIMSAMKSFGMQRAREQGWPNTYVFTKAMGEMMIEQYKGNLEVIILRPTIISSTFREPFPGWIEGVRTIDSVIVPYAKGDLKFFPWDPEAVIDLIPGDMVVNSMLFAVATHVNQSCDHYIYHVGSSLRNPLKISDIFKYIYCYFIKNPWVTRGKPIKVEKIMILTSMAKFQRHIALYYLPLLKGLELINMLFCRYFQSTYFNFKKKINTIILIVDFYKPYLFFRGVFDDINTEKLRIASRDSDGKIFYFDPLCINWEDYFMNIHLPGVTKFLA